MLCVVGGTGITPALQAMRDGLDRGASVGLLYSCRTSLDCLLLDEVKALEGAQ